MNNRIDLHKLLLLSAIATSLLTFAPNAKSDTQWKVSGPATKAATKLPAKALSKPTTAQVSAATSKRSPASDDVSGKTSSGTSSGTGGNPDLPLTASPTSSALASAIPASINKKLAAIDPNSAVEIRGQARTLSMMLVLKNGKDNINFIKVRKDYRSEIAKTEY